jgi:hypothetical protein
MAEGGLDVYVRRSGCDHIISVQEFPAAFGKRGIHDEAAARQLVIADGHRDFRVAQQRVLDHRVHAQRIGMVVPVPVRELLQPPKAGRGAHSCTVSPGVPL